MSAPPLDPGRAHWALVLAATDAVQSTLPREPLPSPLTLGCRIVIAASEEEGWGEERGELMSDQQVNGTIVVLVDEIYRTEGDDGLRELATELAALEPAAPESTVAGGV